MTRVYNGHVFYTLILYSTTRVYNGHLFFTLILYSMTRRALLLSPLAFFNKPNKQFKKDKKNRRQININ